MECIIILRLFNILFRNPFKYIFYLIGCDVISFYLFNKNIIFRKTPLQSAACLQLAKPLLEGISKGGVSLTEVGDGALL